MDRGDDHPHPGASRYRRLDIMASNEEPITTRDQLFYNSVFVGGVIDATDLKSANAQLVQYHRATRTAKSARRHSARSADAPSAEVRDQFTFLVASATVIFPKSTSSMYLMRPSPEPHLSKFRLLGERNSTAPTRCPS